MTFSLLVVTLNGSFCIVSVPSEMVKSPNLQKVPPISIDNIFMLILMIKDFSIASQQKFIYMVWMCQDVRELL